MAKKKTEGLLIVDLPDLFAGLDLFEEGWQTAISDAPDIAVAAATEELPEIIAAVAEPAPVTDEPIEVSLDSIFGEVEVNLLDQAVSPVSPAGATISVAAGPAGSQPLPAWRERESILEDIGRTERAVVLQRIGRRAVAVTPRDLMTAALLKSYVAFDKLGFAYNSEEADESLQPITDVNCRSKDCRLYFPLKSLLTSPFIQESLLWKHLGARTESIRRPVAAQLGDEGLCPDRAGGDTVQSAGDQGRPADVRPHGSRPGSEVYSGPGAVPARHRLRGGRDRCH
jgi:hypothetical protein